MGINKLNLKIIAATSMCIFSLFALFSGTIAWFNVTQAATDNANNMGVKPVAGKLKAVYFHELASKEIDSKTKVASSFTFSSAYSGKIEFDWESKTADYDGNATVSLSQYTPLDPEHPVLMVFEMNEGYQITGDGELTITAKTDVTGFLGARTASNAPLYSLDGNGVYYSKTNSSDASKTDYYYAMSSVAKFYCTDASTELYNKPNGENTTLINPTYAVADLRDKADSAAALAEDEDAVVPDLSFVNVDNAAETFTYKQEPTIYTSVANTTVKYISIIVDYYEDAIEYIYSTYLGNTVLENELDGTLDFVCDWDLEVL